jgi:PhnB protein
MAKARSHFPEGVSAVTPMLVLPSCVRAIAWYEKAFGAVVLNRAEGPTPGSTIHAQIRIGGCPIFMADDMPMSKIKSPGLLGGATSSITLYVPNVDEVFKRAVVAGAEVVQPVADMFWGDRYSTIRDPFGCYWSIATHQEDVNAEEMERRTRDFFASMAKAS